MEKLGYCEDFFDTEKAGSGWDQQITPTGALFCYHLLLWWLSVTTLAVQSKKKPAPELPPFHTLVTD